MRDQEWSRCGRPARRCYFASRVVSKKHATRFAARGAACGTRRGRKSASVPPARRSAGRDEARVGSARETVLVPVRPAKPMERIAGSCAGARGVGAQAKKSPASAPGSSHEPRPSMGGLTASASHSVFRAVSRLRRQRRARKEASAVPSHSDAVPRGSHAAVEASQRRAPRRSAGLAPRETARRGGRRR